MRQQRPGLLIIKTNPRRARIRAMWLTSRPVLVIAAAQHSYVTS